MKVLTVSVIHIREIQNNPNLRLEFTHKEILGIAMSDRIRLVVMGDSCVGKSSIVKRFLFGEFNIKHIPTIEGNDTVIYRIKYCCV